MDEQEIGAAIGWMMVASGALVSVMLAAWRRGVGLLRAG
jgi:hypothetical protein